MNESPTVSEALEASAAPAAPAAPAPVRTVHPAPAPMAFLLIGSVHQLEARLETALGQVGLSLAKFGVLSKLVAAGEPVALGCLAERCSCVRSNMTQLVDRLEVERLVERVSDPTDRRSVRAALTELGRLRHAEGARALAAAEGAIFSGLAEEERATLARLVRQVGQET